MAYNRNQKHRNQNNQSSYKPGQGGKRKKQFRKNLEFKKKNQRQLMLSNLRHPPDKPGGFF